jgi:hypothetical protein
MGPSVDFFSDLPGFQKRYFVASYDFLWFSRGGQRCPVQRGESALVFTRRLPRLSRPRVHPPLWARATISKASRLNLHRIFRSPDVSQQDRLGMASEGLLASSVAGARETWERFRVAASRTERKDKAVEWKDLRVKQEWTDPRAFLFSLFFFPFFFDTAVLLKLLYSFTSVPPVFQDSVTETCLSRT